MLLDPGAQNHRQITYTYKATEMKEDRQLWWQILGGSIQVFVILFLYFSKFLSFSKQKHIDVSISFPLLSSVSLPLSYVQSDHNLWLNYCDSLLSAPPPPCPFESNLHKADEGCV